MDAIVVPASRPAANLLPTMEVAAELGCHFVAMCSGRTQLHEAAGLAVEVPDLTWTLVDLHDGWSSELVRFETTQVGEATASRLGDLSLKRNIGLLLARLAGWAGLIFLDDDIRDVSPRTVRLAAAALRPGWATGMIAEDFPDNSVVCHALRLTGEKQGVFVSGSALAVDTTVVESFFPEVYNEDWLFMYDRVRARRVCATGVVRQAHYLPYADPARAASEEFGDLLAEGLMSLLHARVTVKRALGEDYWDRVIEQRHALLESIAKKLAGADLPDAGAALAAVNAARTTLGSLDSAVLAMYVRRWRQDVRDWRKRVDALPRGSSLDSALDSLSLRSVSPRRPAVQQEAPIRRSAKRVGSWVGGWRSPVLVRSAGR